VVKDISWLFDGECAAHFAEHVVLWETEELVSMFGSKSVYRYLN